MRIGIWILCFFAAAWAVAGTLLGQAPEWWFALAAAISAALVLLARRAPGLTASPPHVRRLVRAWSAAEGIAMLAATVVLANLGRQEAIPPVLAIIVGLHFLPLAKGIPVRLYYATGAALIALGAAGLVAPALSPVVVGWTAAAVLWASALLLIRGVR
jgi:hypothetical protein